MFNSLIINQMKKNDFLKYAVVAFIAATVNVAAYAQEKGDMAAGANVAVGMGDNLTNYGIGGKFQYSVTDPIRVEGSLTFFLPKNFGVPGFKTSVSFWDFCVNGHYLFPVADKVKVYPLAGLGIQGWRHKSDIDLGVWGASGKATGSDICVNLGGGADFKLTDNLILNGELKYRISGGWDRFLISVGVAYKF
jgi:outer membrane protein X